MILQALYKVSFHKVVIKTYNNYDFHSVKSSKIHLYFK